MKELQLVHNNLQNRKLMHGFWDNIFQCSGSLPETREGASTNLLNDRLFIFGGFSRILFNDLKAMNLSNNHWKQILPVEGKLWPKVRSYHTINVFEENLVLFGGVGPKIENVPMRVGYNELMMFDINNETWRNVGNPIFPPKKRYGHVSGIMGGLLLLFGGKNPEGKNLFDDFHLFDFGIEDWVPL